MPSGNIGNISDQEISASVYETKQKMANANAQLHLSGEFNGATIRIDFKADGGPTLGTDSDGWLAIDDAVYTDKIDDILNFPNTVTLRLYVTDTGSLTSIDWNIT